jgi:hypothetical protein
MARSRRNSDSQPCTLLGCSSGTKVMGRHPQTQISGDTGTPVVPFTKTVLECKVHLKKRLIKINRNHSKRLESDSSIS